MKSVERVGRVVRMGKRRRRGRTGEVRESEASEERGCVRIEECGQSEDRKRREKGESQQ